MAGVLALVSESLLYMSGAGADIRLEVQEIERDLTLAPQLEVLEGARKRLAVCLEKVRHDGAGNSSAPTAPGESDSLTGLPDFGYAVAAMCAVWNHREDHFAAIFALDRLDAINLRFGFKTGDQVLLTLSRHIAAHLAATDQFFRWRGPCLMALVKRQMPESLAAAEMSRAVSTRLEQAITIGKREVMVPISTSWNLFPLSAVETLESMVSHLNEFAMNRTRSVR